MFYLNFIFLFWIVCVYMKLKKTEDIKSHYVNVETMHAPLCKHCFKLYKQYCSRTRRK